jgi:hypothetical protein
MYYIYVSGSHLHVTIDHAKQGRVEPPEPVPVEDDDYEQDQGKTRWIKQQYLSLFYSSFILFMILGCALSSRSWINNLVALWQLFDLSLWPHY